MTKPIRVLMVNYKMQCAGIESFIMNMYRNIDRSKVQFDFLVHYKEPQFYDEEIRKLGGKIYRFSVREDNNIIKYFRDLKSFFKNHKEYQIVHGHMESFGMFYLKAAKKAGVPVRIAHSHIAQKNPGIKGFLKQIMNRGFKKNATHLFACSEVAGQFVFGKEEKFTIYNNAIDTSKFKYNEIIRKEIRKELEIPENSFVVGHVGRFNTQKNHEFLIDIFKEIHAVNNNSILLLLGEGNLMDSIKRKVCRYGLINNVIFLGVRSDSERIYQAMDTFIMPSLFEGLPVSGIEAQTSGLKCFFSDTITEQTSLVDENVKFLSLKKTAKEWADEVIKDAYIYTRKSCEKEIISSGYDIREQAEKLKNFYINSVSNR